MAKVILGYTIKSTSEEGIYYLVNHWQKHKTFWIEKENLKPEMLFKTVGYAQRSLKKLLDIMEDYRTDKFELVEVYELNTDLEVVVIMAECGSVEG